MNAMTFPDGMLILGFCVYLVGCFSLLISSYQISLKWAFAWLLPLTWLPFAVLHWNSAKRPLMIQVIGLVIMLLGLYFQPLI